MGRKRQGEPREEEEDHSPSKSSLKKQKNTAKPSSLGQELDYETFDLFQLMTEAAVEGYFTIEQMIELCYTYGVEHGKVVANNLRRAGGERKYHPNLLIPELTDGSWMTPESSTNQSMDFPSSTNGEDLSSEVTTSTNMVKESSENGKNGLGLPTTRSRNGLKLQPPSVYPQLDTPTFKSSNYSSSVSSAVQGSASSLAPQYIGVSPVSGLRSTRKATETQPQRYQATLELFGKKLTIGEYNSIIDAAQAHDRALIRAIGPGRCKETDLNFDLRRYCKDPLESFSIYDSTLRNELFGTEWKGVQDCDFSFLLLAFPSYQELKRARLSKYSR